MATYQFAVTSHNREFRVKDAREVLSVFQELGYEESELYGDSDNPFERGNGDKLFIGSYEKCIEDDIVIVDNTTGKAVAVFTECGDNVRALDEELQDKIEEEFEDEEKYSHVLWFDYLQSKLLDDEQIAVLTESGFEKLRYAGAYTCIVSKKGIFHNSTDKFIMDTVDKLVDKK